MYQFCVKNLEFTEFRIYFGLHKNKIKRPMGKSSKKSNRYDAVRAMAVRKTADKYKVTKEYVRGAVNGTFKGGQTEEIARSYRETYQSIENLVS